jgi:hypothetical protein
LLLLSPVHFLLSLQEYLSLLSSLALPLLLTVAVQHDAGT